MDKLRLPKNCTDSTYGDTKKQYDPALSAKDPGQENNNEGARPVMQVWKLLQGPRGAEPPSVKSADIIIQAKPFMLVMTGDNQIFGTDPILTTVEPVKMIQKLPR